MVSWTSFCQCLQTKQEVASGEQDPEDSEFLTRNLDQEETTHMHFLHPDSENKKVDVNLKKNRKKGLVFSLKYQF